MSVVITPYGKSSVWIDKVFRDGSHFTTNATRYENGVVAYDNPFPLSKEDRSNVEKWFSKHPDTER